MQAIRNFLTHPFTTHVLIAALTVAVVVLNQRLNLGLTQDQVTAAVAIGISLILGKSFHDAANIVGDAHYAAQVSSAHIAAGNNEDGSPKS